jgi:hypothetical protein
MGEQPSGDLDTKGFLVVPGFFGPVEVAELLEDFRTGPPPSAYPHGFKLMGRRALKRVWPTIQGLAERVRNATSIDVDLLTRMTFSHYIVTERTERTSFWHQDFDVDYRLTRDHKNYLNFYVPIVKPDPRRSNVSVIPFDTLRERSESAFERLDGGGGLRLVPDGRGRTQVFGNNGEIIDGRDANEPLFMLEFDIDELAVTPSLAAGDLLLMRGDLIHRTQDTTTARTSASIRVTSSKKRIARSRMPETWEAKDPLAWLYDAVDACAKSMGRVEITIDELEGHIAGRRG